MNETQQIQFLPHKDMPRRIKAIFVQLFASYTCPSARELLELMEKELGWSVRCDLVLALTELIDDHGLLRQEKDYLISILRSGELNKAIVGDDAPDKESVSSIDALLRQSRAYRTSEAFREMIEFMANFRDYAPFNNMLVRVQNPSCGFYATINDWEKRFERTLIEDARPMLILAPMHPVLLVYDLDQTQGKPFPEEVNKFAHFEGDFEEKWLDRMIENAAGHRINVGFKMLSSTGVGFATTRETGIWKMRIVIHDQLDPASRFGVLCHELAHILLGHLGTDKDLWWPCRTNLTHDTIEIEAESTAYIVASRFGLVGSSNAYVARHLDGDELPQSVSIDLIAKVAGHLERMAKERMPPRRPKKVR